MRYIFNLVRALLMSVPLAILWVLVYFTLFLGWNRAVADKFIFSWNSFVEDAGVELGGTE